MGEIQAKLEVPASALSHHLERLARTGLLEARRQGTFIYYSAMSPTLRALTDYPLGRLLQGREEERMLLKPKLSTIDRFLPFWTFVAMGPGLALGRAAPSPGPVLDAVKVGGDSLPIAVGLFWMMDPVLAKVRYERLASVGKRSRLFAADTDFGLAIAVAIGLFGIASGEALAGVALPLIEVPALLALVYLSPWWKQRFTFARTA